MYNITAPKWNVQAGFRTVRYGNGLGIGKKMAVGSLVKSRKIPDTVTDMTNVELVVHLPYHGPCFTPRLA